jgi:hypothetical protein
MERSRVRDQTLRVDVKEVIDPTVRELAFEDIERRELAGLLDADAALDSR